MAVSESVAGWSKTAATNASADTGINLAEGQSPGSVNNAVRGVMAGVANYRDDIGGQLTLAGGTTAYTLTTNQGLDTAYKDGDMVSAVVNATNTGASTLNVDSIGAKSIRKITNAGEVAAAAGDLVAAQHAIFQYDASADSASGGWILLNPMLPDAATQAQMETGTTSAAVVTPAVQHYHQSAVKAWGKWNDAGTLAASYNITSITDSGTGRHVVNWDIDFSSANYSANFSMGSSSRVHSTSTQAAGTLALVVDSTGGGASDPGVWFISACGDL